MLWRPKLRWALQATAQQGQTALSSTLKSKLIKKNESKPEETVYSSSLWYFLEFVCIFWFKLLTFGFYFENKNIKLYCIAYILPLFVKFGWWNNTDCLPARPLWGQGVPVKFLGSGRVLCKLQNPGAWIVWYVSIQRWGSQWSDTL